jgi:hypothetical protein
MKRWVGTTDIDGIESRVGVETFNQLYPYPAKVYRVIAEPTARGRRSEAYAAERRRLGDHWTFDLSSSWFMPSRLPPHLQKRLNAVVDELRAEGAISR